ncbi:signal transduction histidine kinase [Rhizobium sp. CF080]|uniref:blue-light-activated histidine kinase n=1 Tax=Rhizobium sp. (strain CF080) TaxID=1144310 RepID=UPI000271568C|nr:PAS domain-containing protein [Rhizobium sp. CF080]EUB98349.1 signal transduction histidine kinase [Rhizobium sp. CF080]
MSNPEPSDIHGDLPAAATNQGMVDRKELSAFAFQRTRMPMVVSDARQSDFPIVLANDAFLDLTGYSADEILGRNCRLLQGEATSRTALAQIRAAITQQREATIEILNYKKDGTPFWNQLHLSPIHDVQGELAYYFASQIDVTDYRRVEILEEAEHRLLLEVDHRTKNVLAIVDSVVRLSRSDNAASYAASVQQRVQALSRTHMLLAEKGWQEVELADIIRTQVQVFDNCDIEIEGPVVMIPAPSAQPIGLAIHELAANAAVHGALSKRQGRLSINWVQDGPALTITWHERGGPKPAKEPGSGFGNILLGAVVEEQLGGHISRAWRDEGLLLVIELPPLNRVGRGLQVRP